MAIIETDVVIIGAGPVGLFQVFELGLQGLKAVVIDALPQAGGQCTELYPDKPIFDIPAVPECTGQQLIDNLEKQIAPFSPQMHLDQTVEVLDKRADQDWQRHRRAWRRRLSAGLGVTVGTHCKVVDTGQSHRAFSCGAGIGRSALSAG